MKTLSPWAMLLATVLYFISFPTISQAQCEISNGDFELWIIDTVEIETFGGDTFDYEWELVAPTDSSFFFPLLDFFIVAFTGDTNGITVKKSSDSYSGNYALHMDVDTGGLSLITGFITCSNPGETLRLYIKPGVNTVDTFTVVATVLDTNYENNSFSTEIGGGLSLTPSDSVIGVGDTMILGTGSTPSYIQVDVPIDSIAPGTPHQLSLTLIGRAGPSAPADFYVDDISFVGSCIPDSTPTVTNASLAAVTSPCSIEEGVPPTALDACGSLLIGVPNVTFPITIQGTTTVTWTYTDSEGNDTTQSQDFIVDSVLYSDTEPPTPDQVSLAPVSAQCSAAAPTAPTATDDCDGTITGTTSTVFPLSTQGSTIVTWTFTDAAGNASTQNQTFVVDDNTAPVPDLASLPEIVGQCSVSSAPSAPTATDNCDGSIVGTTSAVFPFTAQGTTSITWTFTDSEGNSSTQSQNIVVSDTIDPILVATDTVIYIDSFGDAFIDTSFIHVSSSDNCEIDEITLSQNFFSCSDIGAPQPITITVTDINGNSTSQIRNVTVLDTIAPLLFAGSVDVILGPDGTGTADVNLIDEGSYDNCSLDTFWIVPSLFDCSHVGETPIMFYGIDSSGNVDSIPTTVTVYDTAAPTMITADDTLWLDANGNASLNINDVILEVSDTCGVDSLYLAQTNFNCSDTGITNMLVYADDINGNTASEAILVTVFDTIAPIPTTSTLPDLIGACSVSAPSTPTAVDNCSGTIVASTTTTFPITTTGTTIISWTYTDGSGNISVQTQNVIINDTVSPVPNVATLPDINEQCLAVTPTPPLATDNCNGSITGTTSTLFPITTQGTTVVTWVYTDSSGNSTSQTQNIIVADTIPPVPSITSLPTLFGECSFELSQAPTAIDNCDGMVVGVPDLSFPLTALGVYTVEWTYTDSLGNVSSQFQEIQVIDTVAPAPIVSELDTVFSRCPIEAGAAPFAIDNCLDTIYGLPDQPLPYDDPGNTIVTWTFTDSSGNETEQIQVFNFTPLSDSVEQSGDSLIAFESGMIYRWFECPGEEYLVNDTNQLFVPSTSGTYGVLIISEDGCNVKSDCFEVDIIGVNDRYTIEEFDVYPIPSRDQIWIEQIKPRPFKAEIRDLSGNIVHLSNHQDVINELDVEHLASGIYLLSISTDEESQVVRIIKN